VVRQIDLPEFDKDHAKEARPVPTPTPTDAPSLVITGSGHDTVYVSDTSPQDTPWPRTATPHG
jgi:hypothetical protein